MGSVNSAISSHLIICIVLYNVGNVGPLMHSPGFVSWFNASNLIIHSPHITSIILFLIVCNNCTAFNEMVVS